MNDRSFNPPVTPNRAPTLKDVAAHVGVSKNTVSMVLNGGRSATRVSDATRRRILSAAAQLGYRRNAVAAALSTRRLHTIGVVLALPMRGSYPSPLFEYWKDILVAVANSAAQNGLRITLVPYGDDLPRSVQEIADQRVDGIILVSLNDPDFQRSLYQTGVPCVEIGSEVGSHAVVPDNEGGVVLAVAHLAALGHRRIAHWRGPSGAYAPERRATGFAAAVAARGLSPQICPTLSGDADLRDMLRRPAGERPTALLAFNDQQACAAMDTARAAGLRVPEDLSVIGFDNNALGATVRPALTTIDNPLDDQADAALAMLESLWRSEKDIPSRTVLPVRLIERRSTAVAPGAA